MKRIKKIRMWKYMPKRYKKFIVGKCSARDYMDAYFFDTREEMYEYSKKHMKDKSTDYRAKTICTTRVIINELGEIVAYSPNCGDFLFNLEDLGVNTVSHEVSHAVIGYFNRRIPDYKQLFVEEFAKDEEIPDWEDYENDWEELFAYMTGSLNEQVWNYYFKISESEGFR